MAGGTVGGERFKGGWAALRGKDEKREKNIRKVRGRDEDGLELKERKRERERGRGRKRRNQRVGWLSFLNLNTRA